MAKLAMVQELCHGQLARAGASISDRRRPPCGVNSDRGYNSAARQPGKLKRGGSDKMKAKKKSLVSSKKPKGVEGDRALREHLLYLLGGGGAHASFEQAIAGLPSALRGV